MTLKILALTGDPEASIAEIRLSRPLKDLESAGQIALRLRPFAWPRPLDLAWCDLAILQRPTSAREQALTVELQRLGRPWIYEIDDLLIDPAPHLAARDLLLSQRPRTMAMLRAATGVVASTELLAEALIEQAGLAEDRVFQVPNIGRPKGVPLAHHENDGCATLILASSDVQQLGGLGPALVAALADPRLQLLTIGPVARGLHGLGLPPERVCALPALAHAEFLSRVARQPDPVALMPLDNSRFSACKSTIKYFDYALIGVPAICVDRPPYSQAVSSPQQGWRVDDTAPAWQLAIGEAAASATRRRAVALAAREQVQAAHPPAVMAQAWLMALQTTAGRAPARAQASLWQHAKDRALDAMQAPMRVLHAANRRRLTRRRRLPAEAAPLSPPSP